MAPPNFTGWIRSTTDNMAKEDKLLSVIWDLLKVLISFSLLKLLLALATVSGQF